MTMQADITKALGVAPWQLADDSYRPELHMLKETLLSLGNGYIGSRGSFDEALPAGVNHCEGTYLNGVYSSEPITYGESAYGFARNNHKMLQVANGKVMQLTVDGETVTISGASSHSRQLDLKTGVLERQWQWQGQSGKRLQLHSRRFISQANPHLLAIELTITALNFSGDIQLDSLLDAGYPGFQKKDDPRVGIMSIADSLRLLQQSCDSEQAMMLHQAHGSGSTVAAAISHQLPAAAKWAANHQNEHCISQQFQLSLTEGEPLTLHKLVVYCHSNEQGDVSKLQQQANTLLQQASAQSFASHLAAHQQYWSQFWQQADVKIGGDTALQQGIRFNLFSLAQAAGRNGTSNIGAKGLTGPGYDGHYFWDTEIYVVPVLSLTQPETARQLLSHRYSQLDAARTRARQMSHSRGALYPWRTIGGEECSAYFPAGTAQYHINAAIAYAIRSYYLATADNDFIREMGAEMLLETSRLWLELGFFNPRHGNRFEIHQVTGPDEYTAIVNNNFYTNAMVQLQLEFSLQIFAKFPELALKLGVSDSELANWQRAAENMYLPYDEQLAVQAQDDSFLTKKPWDFANTPSDKYPLLLHYHPLVIYRHQVLKQADTVLANVLLDNRVSPAQKARDLAYYEPLTTHDSSLSGCIHSIAFAESGSIEQAHAFFGDSARMDLDNHHGNTDVGVHIACMAGSWLSLVMGFAGLRVRNDGLYFQPRLPHGLPELEFRLCYQGRVLKVSLSKQQACYQLISGEPLTLHHAGQPLQLSVAAPLQCTTGA
ncbi:alpha,alpha-trehalose phosphorylase [Arsukibacterium tuosuense]|uniref:Alpha,alpha-trehalose phosphorylase n=1 Tax=Arsukibacterium tuosuense TaxID=1323745 RepID=A0A285INB9_9GAMM|nr:glycosyl hydrolase family 65 protein [Arsukibacterium tuosuense]SNY49227.1 alpha,alpha-trehalose phosphorylase [Arsukibacterium tuosuense]